MMLDLQNEWKQLLYTLGIDQVQAQPVFTELIRMYQSPGRVYHTLEHIQAMLTWIERWRVYARNLPAIQLATWFHDCIYNPHASDNEEQSALYAKKALSGFALPGATIDMVSHLVLATKTHEVAETWADGLLLLDADLAILGAPALTYATYATAIRQEYSWLPETSYTPARIQILRSFLLRPRIYWTELAYTSLEHQARENLHREIAALS